MPPGPPAVPAAPSSTVPPPGGGKEAEPGGVVAKGPDLPKAFMDTEAVVEGQELVGQIDNKPSDAALNILDEQHKAAKPPAPEAVVPPTETDSPTTGEKTEPNAAGEEEKKQPTAEQTSSNQPSEEAIKQALNDMGLDDTPTNRDIAKHLIATQTQREGTAQRDVTTEEQKKNQEGEVAKERIGQVFDAMSEMYKANPDLVKEYCLDWAKRDPKAAKAFAEEGNEYMKILMQKKAFNKAILIGGLLAALWLMFQTMTSDGQH